MTEQTVRDERADGGTGADRRRLGGALWVAAGVACAGLLIFVFVGENLLQQNPGESALVLGGAVVALLTGVLLITRGGPGVVRWSTIAGIAWLIVFGSWTVRALPDPDGALISTSLITVLGVAGAIVAAGHARRDGIGSTSDV